MPVNYDCYTTAMVAKPAHAVHSRPPQHPRAIRTQEFHYTFITMHRTLLVLPGREPLVNRLACGHRVVHHMCNQAARRAIKLERQYRNEGNMASRGEGAS